MRTKLKAGPGVDWPLTQLTPISHWSDLTRSKSHCVIWSKAIVLTVLTLFRRTKENEATVPQMTAANTMPSNPQERDPMERKGIGTNG